MRVPALSGFEEGDGSSGARGEMGVFGHDFPCRETGGRELVCGFLDTVAVRAVT
jgi:hypothetical protein